MKGWRIIIQSITYLILHIHSVTYLHFLTSSFICARIHTKSKIKNKTPEISSCFNCFLTFYGLEKKVSISTVHVFRMYSYSFFSSLIWDGSNRRIKYIKNYTVNCFKCFKCTFYVSFSSIILMFYSRIPNDFLSNENLLSAL